MDDQFSRTELLLGKAGVERLSASRVAVFGIGGVGGYAAEALVRSGVGAIDLFDSDRISLTNLNRQIYALYSTLGKYKTDAAKERIYDINPNCRVNTFNVFYLPENAGQFDLSVYDYVIDAIDTVTAKIELILRAKESCVPVISSMGAGNKLDALAFEVADIYETSVCPLARVMRRELKARGVKNLKVVYSKEKPVGNHRGAGGTEADRAKAVPGSVSFVPAVAGFILAGEVIKDLALNAEDGK